MENHDQQLDQEFWDQRYVNGNTGWDLGHASTPLVEYVSQIENKNLSILIPGCGNAYEVQSLYSQGFRDITLIDISPTLCGALKKELGDKAKIICDNFFNLKGSFDLVLEQTFFCALDPKLRKNYVHKMHELLNNNGKLAGVLFNTTFDREGPPFGGEMKEYEKLFGSVFNMHTLSECYNSIEPRKGKEVFIVVQKKATPEE